MSADEVGSSVPAETIFKRIEQVRTEILHKLELLAKSSSQNFKDFHERLHQMNIQALAANRNSVVTRHFLYEKELINMKDFVDYSDQNEYCRLYDKEIAVLQDLINDIKIVDSNNYLDLDFLKEKNKIRTLEIWQAQIDRLKHTLADLESINSDESKLQPLREYLAQLEEETKKQFNEVTKMKTPEREYYLKKVEAEKSLAAFLDDKRPELVERLRTLPPLNIQTHLEPYIQELLVEARVHYCVESYNSCIIICCVAIEAVLKDVVRVKESKKEVEMDFADLIAHCLTKEYIIPQEATFLEGVKDQYRNPYVHANLSKIIPKVVVKGVELRGSKVSDLKLITETDAPVLRQIVKKTKDKESAYSLFKETIEFMKRISGKHFDYSGALEKKEE